jgi:hypothetical protein
MIRKKKLKLSLQQAVEASSLPHFLDNRLTDDGEIAARMRALYSQQDSWHSFML